MRRLLAATWPCLLLLLIPLPSPAVSSGATAGRTEWQVLTRANYSSQIRLHPHVLLLVTMPWYGEARWLMAEIGRLVAADEQELGWLKLMVVYSNSEKMLANVIGTTEGIKFVYYQWSVPFKYQGKLRAQAVLSSVRYIMSLKHEETPFEVLRTREDVEAFLESTDKSVLLSEFCGWFTKLANSGSNQNDETTPSKNHTENVDISGRTLTRESDGPLELVMEDEELTYGVGGQLTGSPWMDGFSLANESISDQIEKTYGGDKMLCTVQKFHQFETFYAKLTALARDYFLPPDKLRFGLITERSLLPSLDVGNLEAWLLTIHYPGCASCSVIAKEGDDLRILLQSLHYLNIKEIEADASGAEATFPANRPSVILFIDRLSESSKVRDESKVSLKLLREYVQNNYPSHIGIRGLSSGNSRTQSTESPSVTSTGTSDPGTDPTRLHTLASKFMRVGENMEVMVVNDGESISYRSAGQGSLNSPLYDVLKKLLSQTRPAHRTKKTRISLVAKDAGLQLLSNDFEVQVVDALPAQNSDGVTDDSMANSDGANDDTKVSVDETKIPEAEYIDDGQAPNILEKTPANNDYAHDTDLKNFSDAKMMDEQNNTEASDMRSGLSKIQEGIPFYELSSNEVGDRLCKDEKIITENLDSLESDQRKGHFKQEKSRTLYWQDEESVILGPEAKKTEGVISEDDLVNLDRRSEESNVKSSSYSTFSLSNSPARDDADYTEHITSSMRGGHLAASFFFSDGGYRLLETLTGRLRIPSMVIIDPVQQKHYVFPEEIEFSYSSLAKFFDSFVNQTLGPYYRSGSPIINSKELPRPPFVNQDFHEANSIPKLTASTFCELVFGFDNCHLKNEAAFSISENIASAWKRDVLVLFTNSWCGFCQRTELVIREVHRAFKSFVISSLSQSRNIHNLQIEEKDEKSTTYGLPAIYLMDCTLNDCYPFLQSAGKDELYPTLLLYPAENKTVIAYEGGMSVVDVIEFLESHLTNSRHLVERKGFLWKGRRTMQHDVPSAIQFHISDKSSSSIASHLSSNSGSHKVRVVTGSIITATEKLKTAIPFDDAKVLIVSAYSHEGFQGIIINKRLRWDVFNNLDSTMESLKLAPLFYGGPVVENGYHLVSLSRTAFEGYTPVIPGIYYGNSIATGRLIEQIKSCSLSANDLWFFLGYSGWGYNQLLDELTEGAWLLSEKPIDHLDWPES